MDLFGPQHLSAGPCSSQPSPTGLPVVPPTCQAPACRRHFRPMPLGQEHEKAKEQTPKSLLPFFHSHSAPSCPSGLVSVSPSQEGLSGTPIQGRLTPPTALCLRPLNVVAFFICLMIYLLFIIHSLCVIGCPCQSIISVRAGTVLRVKHDVWHIVGIQSLITD